MPENGISEAEYALFREWLYATKKVGGFTRPPTNNAALPSNPLYLAFIKDTSFKGDLSQANLASYASDKYESVLKDIRAGRDHKESFDLWYDSITMMKQVQGGKVDISALPDFPQFQTKFQTRREYDIKTKGKLGKGGFILYEGNAYKDEGGIPVPANEAYEDYLEEKGLAREQFEWGKQKDIKAERLAGQETAWKVTEAANKQERARQKEAAELEIAQINARLGERTRAQRESDARQTGWQAYTSEAEKRLNQLTKPADWITRWQVQNSLRYYPQESPKWYQAKFNIDQAREQTNLAAQQLQSGVITPQQYEGRVQNYFATVSEGTPWITAQQQAVASGERLANWGERRPSAPPVPAWLPAFAPGQTGEEITKENIPTPSPQLWARTPWSVQEGLRGYTEWAGGRSLQDIEDEMRMMQVRGPGAGTRQSWQTARQRV